ncbi:MAG: BatA domain-containing protein [Thermoplasmata archaeon]
MRSGPRVVLTLFSILFTLGAGFPFASGQAAATYSLGDFWEYAVEARLDTLLGFGNISGSLAADGETRAEVSAVSDDEATLTWSGEHALQGRFTLPGETIEAVVAGTIGTSYEEHRRSPYYLPVAFNAQTTFEGTISFIVSLAYTANLGLNATLPPSASSPTFPLEVGTQTFTTTGTVASNVMVEFPGMGFENSTVEEVMSTIRWNVTESASVEVPQGTFSGLRVTMEAVTGFVPSPFQGLVPGTVQVAHHSPDVGSPVLFQFLVNETEVGRASLTDFSYASSVPPPFWQNPIFLGGLLAIPIALLVYRYWRERRRGL